MMGKSDEQNRETPLYGVVDERTREIVYRGDAYAGRFLLFAVLAVIILREFTFFNPITAANWDLMAIVIMSGIISTIYQVKHKVIFPRPRTRGFVYLSWLIGLGALIAFIAAKLLF